MVSSKAPYSDVHDRDLERRVTNYLLGHKMPTLRGIEVESDNGTVTIRGRVSSFYQKQLCINCSRRVAGVVRLIDEVTVLTPSDRQILRV
jgi:osmotically-inducible protein OsmY